MSAQHTPSPWFAEGGKVFAETGRFFYHPVAIVGVPLGKNDSRFGELEANARLIAAAPDLLSACLNSIDMLSIDRQAFVEGQQIRGIRTEDQIAHGFVEVEDGVWIAPEDAEALLDYDRAIALIDAAIAKATGQKGGA